MHSKKILIARMAVMRQTVQTRTKYALECRAFYIDAATHQVVTWIHGN